MPQIGIRGGTGLMGLAGYLATHGQRQRQRQMEQEKKGVEEQRKLWKEQLALLEKHRPDDPGIDTLVDALLKSGGMPGVSRKFRTPLQQQRSEFVRGIGPTVAGYREFEKIGAPTKPIQPPTPPKAPTASSISAARREMEKYQETIATATDRIRSMRKDWKLGPEGVPKTPGGVGRKKEQGRLDEWNKWNRILTTAQDSLARIQQWAKEKGVTLKFGESSLPTSEEVSTMKIDEVLKEMESWR